MPLKHKLLIVGFAGLGWLIGCAGPLSLLGVPLMFGFAVWLGLRRYFIAFAIVLLTSPVAVSAGLAARDYARGDACILMGGKAQLGVIDDATGLPIVSTGCTFWDFQLLRSGSHNATLRALSYALGAKPSAPMFHLRAVR
jgi:hypothetical protein